MGYAEADEGLPGISICPRCGARLVTRNLWHSCGAFTLEGLFPGLALANRHDHFNSASFTWTPPQLQMLRRPSN